MSTKALVPMGEMSITEVMSIGEAMAKSGYFSDARQASQAVVKILAGKEMGFGPFASMTGIHIIQGKPAIGANLMAAAVKAHPKYDYTVVELDEEKCTIDFFENGKPAGVSTFTWSDAETTQYWDAKAKCWKSLASKFNWQNYRRNMLFARTISNGVKWYCPDVFLGAPVYTPDELGAEVDGDGDVITVTPTVVEPFDPDHPPPFQSWQEVKETAVRELYYTHVNHVENALAKIFDGQDKKTLTYTASWKGLLDHHRSKELAADDAQEDFPTTEELEQAEEVTV